MLAVTIYSRPGCHLCDEMKALVSRVQRTMPLTLEEIDISSDPQLETLYGLEIPVMFVNGRKAAKYRVTEEALLKILDSRSED